MAYTVTTMCKFVYQYTFQSATPATNGSNQSESVITWAAVATPPPASPRASATSFNQPVAHMMPSSNPVPSLTPQFSLNATTSEANKKSSSAAPNPLPANSHSDFINSFLSTTQDFTSSTTTVSPTKSVAEQVKVDNKTEYESFHADFASFLSEALTEPSEFLSAPSEDGEKPHLNGDHSTVISKDYATSSITAVNQQSQEHTPDSFDTLDNEVSSAQDILSVSLLFLVYKGSRGGAVVRAFASHQCVPGLILGPGVICGLSLLLVLALAPRFFPPGSPVFLPPQKPAFLNSNSIGNSRATGLSVEDCCVSPSLNKVDLFIYLFI